MPDILTRRPAWQVAAAAAPSLIKRLPQWNRSAAS